MQLNGSPPAPESAKTPPPVVPLTGAFIAQLFLVPGVIVATAVLVLLGFSWLAGGSRTPEEFLKDLDNSNADIRWRAASDLAQVLLRDEQLASNPRFALDVAERLHTARQANKTAEEGLAPRWPELSEEERKKEEEKIASGRNYVLYLTACMGNFCVPVGVPLLNEMAVAEGGADARTLARRRLRAVWSLANLGENLKRFDRLPSDRQDAILAQLTQEAETGNRDRAAWAKAALAHLNGRLAGKPDLIGVDKALTRCADDENPFLRENAAFALNFWEGSAEQNAALEKVLVELASDDGRGEENIEEFYLEEKPQTRVVAKSKGLYVRYNATIALARRGSGKVSLDRLQEMLDEDLQKGNFTRKHLKSGRESPDDATAYSTLHNTLKAIIELHRRNPDLDLRELTEAIDKLRRCSNAAVRSQAEETWMALK